MEGGNFLLKFFESLDVNSGLKCKCDLIVKTRMNSKFECKSNWFSLLDVIRTDPVMLL